MHQAGQEVLEARERRGETPGKKSIMVRLLEGSNLWNDPSPSSALEVISKDRQPYPCPMPSHHGGYSIGKSGYQQRYASAQKPIMLVSRPRVNRHIILMHYVILLNSALCLARVR